MSRKKLPQRNYTTEDHKVSILDCCQTPEYALDAIFPYLKQGMRIWEPCAGLGTIVRCLEGNGFDVIATDLKTGHNFLTWAPDPYDYDVIVSNIPFGPKYKFLKRAYELGKPFAFIVPDRTMSADKAQDLYWSERKFEFILMNPRINFFMPYNGYGIDESGRAKSSAQFHSMWYTWGFNVGEPLSVARLTRRPDVFSNITVEMLHNYYREEIEAAEEEKRKKARKESLDELATLSQELGLYEQRN